MPKFSCTGSSHVFIFSTKEFLLTQYLFSRSNRFFSRLLSITCLIAATGCLKIILGPENRITSLIFSLISGL